MAAGPLATLGANLCWQGRDGEAIAVLDKVAGVIEPPINNLASVWAMGCLAVIRTRADDLEAAGRYARKATDLAAEHGLGEYWITAAAVIAMADVLDRQGQTAEAEAAAQGPGAGPAGPGATGDCVGADLPGQDQLPWDTHNAQARLCAAQEIIAACADPGILTELITRTENRANPAHRRRELVARAEQCLEVISVRCHGRGLPWETGALAPRPPRVADVRGRCLS